MSLRTISYSFSGSTVLPDSAQYGGVRFEDNATKVEFVLEKELIEKIENEFPNTLITYRIDFNGALSGYNPSENLEVENGKITRLIPLCMTAAGEQITATLVISAMDENGESKAIMSSASVKIYFDNVGRDECSESEIIENVSACEVKINKICESTKQYERSAERFADQASDSAAESQAAADSADESFLKTYECRMALENGAEFIFLGGDAKRETDIELVIDEQVSSVSENLVKNKAIYDAIEDAKEELKQYTDLEIATFDFIKIVDALPETGLPNRLYLVPKSDTQDNDLFDEYIWANGKWEFITTKQIEVDLTPYVKKTDVADYIVEQGTNGIWTYRKWNSGIAECWGKKNEAIICTEQRNSIYVDSLKQIDFPKNLFVSSPCVNLNAVNATGYNFLIPHVYSVDAAQVSYLPASTGAINDAVTTSLIISAMGRWKESV